MDQSNFLEHMNIEFNNKPRPKKKRNTFDSISASYEVRELNLHVFKMKIFPINATKVKGRPSDLARLACVTKVFDRTQFKILTPKQMLQKLPIALA